MQYIESPSVDPRFNLALEQYVFEGLDAAHGYFMLWQNHNAIIVGRHQNTQAEVNAAFVREHGVSVVRRLSGGGAVYHDAGNLNFTFIADVGEKRELDFSAFCLPVIRALESFGVQAELSGRNDMTIDGRKFSGNAQYRKGGRVMHHGTILYDADLEMVAEALNVSKDKIESKGLASVRSRITNVKPHMPEGIGMPEFVEALKRFMFQCNELQEYMLTDQDLVAVGALKERVYDQWEWNYGRSPACRVHKKRRFENCGGIEVHMDVESGVFQECIFQGDFFSSADPAELAALLRGVRHEEAAIIAALEGIAVDAYFANLSKEDLIRLLVE